MKILHFADLHLDAAFAWAPARVAAKKRQSIRDALSKICDLARELRVDAVTCGGDLYEHERFVPDTKSFLVSTFAAIDPIPVLLAPGNHDWLAPSSIYETATWSSNVHIFRDDVPSPLELRPGLTIWGAAHKAPRNTDDFFEQFHVNRAGLNIGLFHASERSLIHLQDEGKQPHAPFSAAEILGTGLDHALLGHFHMPVDEKDYTYPGNPEPLTFGESGERGPVILEIDNNRSITRKRIRVSQTPLQNIEIDVSNSSDTQTILEIISAKLSDKRGIAQVRLCGEVDKSVSLDRSVLEGRKGALDYARWHLDGLRPAYDLDAISAENTVRGQFVRDVRAANFSDEDDRRRVLITGLRALDGRADLEIV